MPERRFDWDEAKRRFLAGETLAQLARAYGVTSGAIRQAVQDGYREQQRKRRNTYERRQRYDTCRCGAQKTKGSARCRECNAELRLSGDVATDVPKPGKLDYAPRNKRYMLLAVSGQAHASDHWGTTFSILDRYDMDREVKRFQSSLETVARIRPKLVRLVDEMNKAEGPA